jgi:hypothetical protein
MMRGGFTNEETPCRCESCGFFEIGGSGGKLADDGLMYECIGICALVGWPGDAECIAFNGHFV